MWHSISSSSIRMSCGIGIRAVFDDDSIFCIDLSIITGATRPLIGLKANFA